MFGLQMLIFTAQRQGCDVQLNTTHFLSGTLEISTRAVERRFQSYQDLHSERESPIIGPCGLPVHNSQKCEAVSDFPKESRLTVSISGRGCTCFDKAVTISLEVCLKMTHTYYRIPMGTGIFALDKIRLLSRRQRTRDGAGKLARYMAFRRRIIVPDDPKQDDQSVLRVSNPK